METISISANISPDVRIRLPTCPINSNLRPEGTALLFLIALLSIARAVHSQSPQKAWDYSLTVDGFIVPDDVSYVNPTFTADHDWLHLEARYNDEGIRTGSLWIGYNFTAGKNLTLNLTPMIGGVFGRTAGIAPGGEFSLAYKKLELSFSNEYVFDFSHPSNSFYYVWPQLTYSFYEWLKVGGAAQRTKAYQTEFDIQRGFLVGLSRKNTSFTTYVFNPGYSTTVVLEASINF
jgi:hypothetical protein